MGDRARRLLREFEKKPRNYYPKKVSSETKCDYCINKDKKCEDCRHFSNFKWFPEEKK